jgi:hypothetical protein
MASTLPYGYWRYDPSTAAAAVGALLYLATSIISIVQYIRYRAWVWLVFVVALICPSFLFFKASQGRRAAHRQLTAFSTVELLGFIARAISAKNVTERGPYVVQFVLIVIAPVLMAADFYVVFVRPTILPFLIDGTPRELN